MRKKGEQQQQQMELWHNMATVQYTVCWSVSWQARELFSEDKCFMARV